MKVKLGSITVLLAALFVGIVIGRSCTSHTDFHVEAEYEGALESVVKFWTCSMHPEINLPDSGKCPKCAMDLIPVMASDQTDEQPTGLREIKLSPTAQALAEIETSPVERRFVTTEIRMVGKIDYDEAKLAYLTAWVPGRLDRLYVDYTGVQVKKGDHMVYIYSPDLLAAQEELIQSVETVESMKGSDMSLIKDRVADNVVASREKLGLLGLTDKQIADIEKRGTPDDHLTIYSPISGVVIHKNALEGGYVETGTQIYTIADLSQVWVKLDAYESDLSWIHYGQDVAFETESDPGRTFRGTVAFIDPVLNDKTRTVKVRVNVDNRAGDLKPGMFVRATVQASIAMGGRVMHPELAGKMICPMHPEIIKDNPSSCDICGMPLVSTETFGYLPADADTQEAPLVIPASAPLITGRRAIVYVKSPDKPGVFEGREIVLGLRAGDFYLVRRGLSEGEQVVTKGNFKLDAELQIHAKPSMMSPEGGDTEAKGKSDMPDRPLSSFTQSQLRAVLSEARSAVRAVKGGNLTEIRAAFTSLSKQVESVNIDALSGHSALLWKEYLMLLGNDGLEGSTVETLANAKDVAELLREHTASMKKKMRVTQGRNVEESPPVNPEFLVQFGRIINGYIEIQSALAADNFSKASIASKDTLAALSSVDMGLVTGDDHVAWMEQASALSGALTKMANANALEPSRATFAPLSEQIMVAAQRFGAPAGPLYQLRCPMALGGKGATWLQKDKDTRNPYFGKSMLVCGSVIDELPDAADRTKHDHD